MSDRKSTALLGRITATDALDTAKELAGELIGDSVLTWRIGHDLQTGVIEIDGQLCNDAPADLGEWADVLGGAAVQATSVPGVPFGTLAVRGVYGGVPVRIWTAITRTAGGVR